MMKLSKLFSRRTCKGQGIVEYAGAIVVAAVIVGAVIGTTPSFAAMFNDVVKAISDDLTTKAGAVIK